MRRQLMRLYYYEHVVRNERDLEAIREYIVYNANKWDLDTENPRNIKKEASQVPVPQFEPCQ